MTLLEILYEIRSTIRDGNVGIVKRALCEIFLFKNVMHFYLYGIFRLCIGHLLAENYI